MWRDRRLGQNVRFLPAGGVSPTVIERDQQSLNPRLGVPDEVAERAVLALIGLVALVAGLLWLTGQTSAVVSGLGWPADSFHKGWAALAQWPQRWSDPPAAYPAGSAISKVSPAVWWEVCGLLAISVTTVVVLLWRLIREKRKEPTNEWAVARELSPIKVQAPSTGRLVLGRVGRSLVATEARHSVLVIGPTQSGKTTGLAIPALLEWDGPVAAVSVKTDLAEHTMRHRAKKGRVWVYDPRDATGLPGSTWSPVSAVRCWEYAIRLAQDLTEAGRAHSGDGMQQSGFWFGLAAQLLAPYLFAAAAAGETMGTVYSWVLRHDHEASKALLERVGNRIALDQHNAMWKVSDQTRSSVFVTLQQSLSVYSDERVAASTVNSDIDPRRLFDGGRHTLYVAAPIKDQTALQPLFSTLIGHVVDEAFAMVAATGKPLNPPLLILIDEAANVAPMRNLGQIASTAAAQGIQLVTVWQDLSQVKDRYHTQGNTVLNNHRARIVLRGCGDEDTLRWASTMVGDTSVEAVTRHHDANGSKSRQVSERTERLLGLDQARQMDGFDGLLLYGSLPPAKLQLRPWFKDRGLRRLAVPLDEKDLRPALSDPSPLRLAAPFAAPSGPAEDPAIASGDAEVSALRPEFAAVASQHAATVITSRSRVAESARSDEPEQNGSEGLEGLPAPEADDDH